MLSNPQPSHTLAHDLTVSRPHSTARRGKIAEWNRRLVIIARTPCCADIANYVRAWQTWTVMIWRSLAQRDNDAQNLSWMKPNSWDIRRRELAATQLRPASWKKDLVSLRCGIHDIYHVESLSGICIKASISVESKGEKCILNHSKPEEMNVIKAEMTKIESLLYIIVQYQIILWTNETNTSNFWFMAKEIPTH